MKTYQEFLTEIKKTTIARNRSRPQIRPNLDFEKGEFDRYAHGENLRKKAKTAPIRNLTPSETSKLKNSDASEIKPGAQGRRNVRRLANQYGRNVNRVLSQVKRNKDEPSIIHNGELIAGNTRAMVRRSLGKPVKALVIP